MRELWGVGKISTPLYLRKEKNKMACKLFNNGGFGCGGCCHFDRTNSVSLTGSVLVLDIPAPQVNLTNKEKICICVAQSIPAGVTSADTVAVTIAGGATQYPLRTRCGNNVHADQIRCRKVLHTNVATDIPIFVVSSNELCCTGFNFPIIPTMAVAPPATPES